MADLYLHIGAPKTGTSAIQALLTRQREALAAQGVLYPLAGTIKSAHHLIGAATVTARAQRLEGADPERVLAEVAAAIREEVAAHAPRRIILSTEYLWGELEPEQVRRVLEPFAAHRLHLVVYLRRQDLLAQSIYTQAIKGGGVRTFPDWAASEGDGPRAGLHFDRVLDPWRTCGLPVEVHVRVYERGQIDEDVTRDFLSVVCPEVTIDDAAGAGVNTSPDRLAVELMRRINHRLDGPAAASVRRRVAAATPPRETFAPIDFLDGAAAATFLERFAEGNDRIARELLARSDGVLFRDPVDLGVKSHPANGVVMLDRLITLLPGLMTKDVPAVTEEDAASWPPSAASPDRQVRIERRARRRARRGGEAAAAPPTSGPA